jgi:2-polyprenyl-3-methyl-5-hydroxy-6-metoxy-1,4-benzoquinol methylase
MRALPNVAVVCKAWQVSRHCAELLEIYPRHMLEHLTFDEVVAALRDWHAALAVGGKVEILVPNLSFHIDQWRRADWNEESLRDKESDARWGFAGLYGWQRQCNPHARDYDASYWDVHKSGYNEELIRFLLRRVGFCDIEVATRDEAHLVARATKRLDHRERQIAPSVAGIRPDHRGRYEFAARLVPHWGRVLDVGCGVGYGAHIISDRTLALEILAMDVDEEAIAYAREFHRTPKVRLEAGDVLEAELRAGRYDVAVAFEVIEHMSEPSELLQRLRTAIRPDGCLVCSTPNEDRLPFDPTGFPFHVRHYTPSSFVSLLEDAGFAVRGLYSQHSRDSAEVREGSDGLYVIAVCTADAAEPGTARDAEGDGDGGE